MESWAWRAPKLPVMPWTRTLVLGLTRMDMGNLRFQIADLRFIPLVNAKGVAVGVGDESHAADGRRKRLYFECHVARPQVRDGRIEIIDFQTDGTAIRPRIPVRRAATDGK